jgi:hypothetical protein
VFPILFNGEIFLMLTSFKTFSTGAPVEKVLVQEYSEMDSKRGFSSVSKPMS